MRVLLIVLLIYFGICCVNPTTDENGDRSEYKSGFYSDDPNIVKLDSSNFTREIDGRKHAVLVEFYKSWCGDCKRFSPIFKQLASDFKDWRNVLTIAAVHCQESVDVCRQQYIGWTPTLLYFHENYKVGLERNGTNITTDTDIFAQKCKILTYMVEEQRNERGKQFPDILPYTASDTTNLYDNLENVDYILFVLEDKERFAGPEIATDLRNVSRIAIKYSLYNNTELSKTFKVKNFPAIVVVPKSGEQRVLGEGVKTISLMHLIIRQYLKLQGIQVPVIEKPIITPPKSHPVNPSNQSDIVFKEDMEYAVRYSLRYEAGGYANISGEKLVALINYVKVLRKYFPIGSNGQKFLTDLERKLENGTSVKGLDLDTWVQNAEKEKEKNKIFSFPVVFVACKGSKSHLRGFPCTLWKMFHYLTVDAAIRNGNDSSADPLEILNAVHGYAKHIFQCGGCSRDFQKMAKEKHMESVNSTDNAVLWLWDAHNEVTKRLAGDITEDPVYPKIQFPSPTNCPPCKNSSDEWNLPEVLNYLKKVYNRKNIVYSNNGTNTPWVPTN